MGVASEGKALVAVSSDLVELMALCDRILVMSLGPITPEFTQATRTLCGPAIVSAGDAVGLVDLVVEPRKSRPPARRRRGAVM